MSSQQLDAATLYKEMRRRELAQGDKGVETSGTAYVGGPGQYPQQIPESLRASPTPEQSPPQAATGERVGLLTHYLAGLSGSPEEQVNYLNSKFGKGSAELRAGKDLNGKPLPGFPEVYLKGRPFNESTVDSIVTGGAQAVTSVGLDILQALLPEVPAENLAKMAPAAGEAVIKYAAKFLNAARGGPQGTGVGRGIINQLGTTAVSKAAPAISTGGSYVPPTTPEELLSAVAAPAMTSAGAVAAQEGAKVPGSLIRGGARALQKATGETAGAEAATVARETGIRLPLAGGPLIETAKQAAATFPGTRNIVESKLAQVQQDIADFAKSALGAEPPTSATTAAAGAAGIARTRDLTQAKTAELRKVGGAYNYIENAGSRVEAPAISTKKALRELIAKSQTTTPNATTTMLERRLADYESADKTTVAQLARDIKWVNSELGKYNPDVPKDFSDAALLALKDAAAKDIRAGAQKAGRDDLANLLEKANKKYAAVAQERSRLQKSPFSSAARNAEKNQSPEALVMALAAPSSKEFSTAAKARGLARIRSRGPEGAAAADDLSRQAMSLILYGGDQDPTTRTAAQLATVMKNRYNTLNALTEGNKDAKANLARIRGALNVASKMEQDLGKRGNLGYKAVGLSALVGAIGLAAAKYGAVGGTGAAIGIPVVARYLTAVIYDNEASLLTNKLLKGATDSGTVRRLAESLARPEIQQYVQSIGEPQTQGEQ